MQGSFKLSTKFTVFNLKTDRWRNKLIESQQMHFYIFFTNKFTFNFEQKCINVWRHWKHPTNSQIHLYERLQEELYHCESDKELSQNDRELLSAAG